MRRINHGRLLPVLAGWLASRPARELAVPLRPHREERRLSVSPRAPKRNSRAHYAPAAPCASAKRQLSLGDSSSSSDYYYKSGGVGEKSSAQSGRGRDGLCAGWLARISVKPRHTRAGFDSKVATEIGAA